MLRRGELSLILMASSSLPIIGWREWVALPELGLNRIKAKVDTGARSSALHAFNFEYFEREGQFWIRFKVQPYQKDLESTVMAEAMLLEERSIRSSNGQMETRPVIRTTIDLQSRWSIDLTLTDRRMMGFRCLLGREAIRQRFCVDPGRSFLYSPSPVSV